MSVLKGYYAALARLVIFAKKNYKQGFVQMHDQTAAGCCHVPHMGLHCVDNYIGGRCLLSKLSKDPASTQTSGVTGLAGVPLYQGI